MEREMRRYIARAHEREEVDIAARVIVPAERLTIIHCRIVDRSEGGIRVEMAAACPLPAKIFVIGDEDDALYECETRWQTDTTAGLMLIDVCMYSMRRALLAKVASAMVLRSEGSDKGGAERRAPAACTDHKAALRQA
jgi:hypothetical protein